VTERELPLTYVSVETGDDPGLQLPITFEYRHEPLDARNWLPESRLREIGFSMNVPAGAPDAPHVYDRVPPRLAWVVLEYAGEAWRDIERRRALKPPDQKYVRSWSRLVPVDAGLDYDALRVRYPSNHVILRGVIGMHYLEAESGGPLLYGVLRELVPASVAVPYEFRPLLRGLASAAPGDISEPRYEAELAVGELGLPYLQSVRLRE
jgi:hypothetical protein